MPGPRQHLGRGPWPLALHYPQPLLAHLAQARVARTKALAARERLSAFLTSVNTVLARYEWEFPELRRDMLRLQQQIRELRYGAMAPDQEGRSFTNVTEMSVEGESSRLDDTRRYECKRFFRSLAQLHHPDKGGDLDYFQALRRARDDGDIDYLRVQYITSFKLRDLRWLSTEAPLFWSNQEKKAGVNKTRLQGLAIFKVVAAHVSGAKARAHELMGLELASRLQALRTELVHATIRASGSRPDVDPLWKPNLEA